MPAATILDVANDIANGVPIAPTLTGAHDHVHGLVHDLRLPRDPRVCGHVETTGHRLAARCSLDSIDPSGTRRPSADSPR